jgi:hypothetical protein
MIAPPVTTSAYDREDDTGAAMDGLGGGFDRVFLFAWFLSLRIEHKDLWWTGKLYQAQ